MDEKAPFAPKGRLCWLEGRHIWLEERRRWRKGAPFRIRRAPSPARRRTCNFFDAKTDIGLKYLANGDEKRRSFAFGEGAPDFIREELPALQLPLDPPLVGSVQDHTEMDK